MASLGSTCEAIAQGRFEDMEQLFGIVADETLPTDIRELAETLPAWSCRSRRGNSMPTN